MKNIKAVLFDMDGVIFDTERIYLEEWIEIFNKYGYKMTKEIYLPCMGTGRVHIKKRFKEIFGQDLPIEQMYIEKDAMLSEAVSNGKIPIKMGAIEILDFLRDNNIKIALATSARKERLLMQLDSAKIKDKFDALVCRDDVKNLKPDPEIFLQAAERLNVKPEECIVIEDSEAGIKAAYNGKMIGLHVEDLKKADEDLLKYCKKSFNNLVEIKNYISDGIK